MGARGSCNVCFDPRRAQIDAARAGGMPVATIARTFSIATTTLGRHFKHARPKPRATPAPESLIMVLFREDLERNAAATGVPFADLVFHRLHCERKDIAARSEAEADELMDLMETFATPQEFQEMFGEAADRGTIYVPR